MGKFTKKIILPVVMAVAGTVFISCGKEYKVTFVGVDNSQTLVVKADGKVERPINPEKENAIFGGWFKDENCEQPWDFDKDKITKDTKIYAKWIYLYDISLPNARFDTDGYKVEIEDNLTKVSAGSNYKIKLTVNALVYNANNFVLMINNENYAYPTYTEIDGVRTYIYNIENVGANQNIQVVGLTKKSFTASFTDLDKLDIEDVNCSRNAITYGSSYKFKVHLKKGYSQSANTMLVLLNNKQVFANNGVYEISDVKENLNISFTRIFKNTYSISLPSSSDSTPKFTLSGNDTFSHGDEQIFILSLGESYKKIDLKQELIVKVGEKDVIPTIDYDDENDNYKIIVSSEQAVGNIEILLDDSDWQVSKYKVKLNSGEGYHFETTNETDENGNCLVSFGGKIDFKLVLDDDYMLCDTFSLFANNTNITNLLLNTTDNIISLSGIKTDYEISLQSLSKNKFPVLKADGQEGYEIQAVENSEVLKGESFKFRVQLSEGYIANSGITVKFYNYNPENKYYSYKDEGLEFNGNIRLAMQNGDVYTIQNISQGVRVLVEGIEKQTFSVNVPTKPSAYEVMGETSVKWAEDYTFRIKLNNDYKDSLNDMVVRFNGFSVAKTIIDDQTAEFKILNVRENISAENLIIDGIYKNEYVVTFTTETVRSGRPVVGEFRNYSGDDYTSTTYTQVVKRGANAVAPTADIVAPEHYKLNENRPYSASFDNINDDLIIYINFVPISYYITFDLQGGTNNPANNSEGGNVYRYSYSIERPINLKDPTRKIAGTNNEYKFVGWFYEENGEWLNINTFDGYKNLQVKAVWQLEVGNSKAYKTLQEAVAVATNGDELLIEEGTYLNQGFATNLNLTLIGENNVEIVVNNMFSPIWNEEISSSRYGIINANNGSLKIKNIKFVANENSMQSMFAITSLGSDISLENVQFEGLNALCVYGNSDNKLKLDGVSINSDVSAYAVEIYAKDDGFKTEITNTDINAMFGILYGYNDGKKANINISNARLKSGNINMLNIEGVGVKIDGEHNIQNISISFENIGNSIAVEKVDRLSNSGETGLEFNLDRINAIKNKIQVSGTEFALSEQGNKKEFVITNLSDASYSILGHFDNENYEVELSYLGFLYIQDAFNVSDNVFALGDITLNQDITIPLGKTLTICPIRSEAILEEGKTLTVAGKLVLKGDFNALGNIVKETTGEIESTNKVIVGTKSDLGLITEIIDDGSIQETLLDIDNQLINGENVSTVVSGKVVKASGDSGVKQLYATTSNTTGYYIGLQVYVGHEYANLNLSDIYLSNVGGLSYANGTHRSDALTDKVNSYGYLEVVFDVNVQNGVVGLTSCTVEINGKTYSFNLSLVPYAPEVLADRADSMGVIYNFNNDYQTILEKSTSYVSEANNFSNYAVEGCLIEGANATKLNELNTNSTKHYISFRKYVGLQYAGKEFDETYKYNGIAKSNLNLIAKDGKNSVDVYGYVYYIFDANMDYVQGMGGKIYQNFDFENINIFFELDNENYEIRLEKGDLLPYVWNRNNVVLGNTLELGIDGRFLTITGSNYEYAISGGVIKILDNSVIKDISLFYNGTNDALGYFVAYKLWLGKSDGTFKDIANKNVTISVSGYEGRSYYMQSVGNDGFVDFITEIVPNGETLTGGTLNISILVEGEETAKEFVINLNDLVIKQDDVGEGDHLKKNGEIFGIDESIYNVRIVEEGSSYKITNTIINDFVKTNEDSIAYNNEYASVNSSGYFVGLKWFIGYRNYGEDIQFNFEFEKDNASVDSQTRTIKVDKNGYVSFFIDTLTNSETLTLGIDKLTLSYTFDGENKEITIDFSELEASAK